MGRTVLVVDDDAATRRLYSAFLAKDAEVVSADTGVGAVELIDQRPADVVIMDLNMPGLDGWMAMSLIRARCPQVPFVIVTSQTDPDLESRARHAGATGFLRKPVTADALRQAVDRALRTPKSSS
jgi:CheY-like chemotaxis protein